MRDQGLEVVINDQDAPLPYSELLTRVQGFDALITMLSDKIDESFLKACPQLKVISNYAVGYNNIDTNAATLLRIPVGNTPDVLTEATAEVALGLMIAASRNFLSANKSASVGAWKNWDPTGHLGQALKGKTLGVIGFGRIGHRLAQMCAHAFSMKIQYYSQSIKENTLGATRVDLTSLLKESDFVSIHLPLNNQTKKLIGLKELSMMKSSAVLINTARGEIIDQDDLVTALKNNLLFAAGLDVTEPEPLPVDHELFACQNAYILPHIGSATYEARREMSILVAKNIIAGLKGERLIAQVNLL
jgi:glyoxylate reductase